MVAFKLLRRRDVYKKYDRKHDVVHCEVGKAMFYMAHSTMFCNRVYVALQRYAG
jgi:hypothetical protein